MRSIYKAESKILRAVAPYVRMYSSKAKRAVEKAPQITVGWLKARAKYSYYSPARYSPSIFMFSRILVGVDGSPFAERALKCAIDLTKKYGAKLIIAHVVLRQFYAVTPSEAGVLATTVFVKEMEAEGKETLSRASAYAKAEGVDYESRLLQGVAAEEIIKLALSEKVDLIVVGSRGLTEVRAFLLGSVSDKLSHHAKIPTLIVK